MKIIIPIEPKAQARPKIRAFKTETGRIMATAYKDAKEKQHEKTLISFLWNKVERGYFKKIVYPTAILLGLKCYLPIPKSIPKYKKELMQAGQIRPTKKPDLDNLVKHFKDCANQILWDDDRQVVGYLPGTGKYYDNGQGPRWEIEIEVIK